MKFITGIDIFIDTSKTGILHVSIESPAQCYPEKVTFMQISVHGIWWYDFLSGVPLCGPQVSSQKLAVLINSICWKIVALVKK